MALKEYFVQCGNWCLRLNMDISSHDNPEIAYTELATEAVEIMFGNKEFTYEEDDYYALINESNVNVLEHENEEIPVPTFTTKIHIISSKKNDPHKLLTSLRTADIFANASQHENYEYALEAEKIEKRENNKNKKKKK